MPPKTASTTRKKVTYRGAVAIIERDGKILMQKRSEHIADPGTWVLPGGAVKRSEKVEDALVRACSDELGITVRPNKEIGLLNLPEHPCPVWYVIWKGKDVKLSGSDITGIGWFTVEELLELEPVRYQEELRTFLSATDFFAGRKQSQDTEEVESAALSSSDVDHARILRLVKKAQAGDHEAFGKIYDEFVIPIHRYAAFRLPAAMAEDITADIFVKAWEKLDTYQGRKGIPFASWLFRIAKNVVIDTYRTQKEIVELDELHIDTDRWNDPTLTLTQEIQSDVLRGAINKLPKRYQEVLLLSFMSDLSHREIAKAMMIREGSVRILKHRALKKLSELLPASMREELP